MSDREQSEELSRLNGELGRFRSEVQTAITEFDSNNGGAALKRLRHLVAPRPQVHVMAFPATAATLRALCDKRSFGENDVLVGDHDQQRGHVAANANYEPCTGCESKRTIP